MVESKETLTEVAPPPTLPPPPRMGVVGGVGWGVGLTTITRGYAFAVTLPEAVLVPALSPMVVDEGGGWNLTEGTWGGGSKSLASRCSSVSDNAVTCALTWDDSDCDIDGVEGVQVSEIDVACDVNSGEAEICGADIGVGVIDCSYGVREVCDSAGERGGSGYSIGGDMADRRGLGMCR